MIKFTQSSNADYQTRTIENIVQSDVTIVFAVDSSSSGTRLTIKEAKKLNRVVIVVDLLEYQKLDSTMRANYIKKHCQEIHDRLSKSYATHLLNDYKANMTFDMNEYYKLPYIQAKNTMEAIKSHQRTATTRHGFEAKKYINLKQGDIITFYGAGGKDFLNAMVTSVQKLNDVPPKLWCLLEGWNMRYYNEVLKPKIKSDSIQIQYRMLPKTPRYVLNIAGNGLANREFEQRFYDELIYDYLDNFINTKMKYKVVAIRSGMQTGADESGLKFAIQRNIPAFGHSPKNWRFRIKDGRDIYDEDSSKNRFNLM